MSRPSIIIPHTHAQFATAIGATPEQVMQHGAVTWEGGHILIPHFTSHTIPQVESEGSQRDIDSAYKMLQGAHEDWEDARAMSHDALVRIALKNHQESADNIGGVHGRMHGGHALNNVHVQAASIIALAHALRGESRDNNVPLFRGMPGDRTPNMDLTEPMRTTGAPRNMVGFSENSRAAGHFATNGNRRGAVYTLEPGEGRGLRLEDYGVTPFRLHTGAKENEWVLHNISKQFVPVIAPPAYTTETPR